MTLRPAFDPAPSAATQWFQPIVATGALAALAFGLGAPAAAQSPVPTYTWTTLAGRASAGAEDGAALRARFNRPSGLAADAAGNLYVADTENHTIRKITPAGDVTTIAGLAGEPGTADGTGAAARFDSPEGVAVDGAGNVYVADTGNHTIRRISPAGVVTTLAGQAGRSGRADGAATSALFASPRAIAADHAGTVYVYNGGLRRIAGGAVQAITQFSGTNLELLDDSRGVLAVDSAGRLCFSAMAWIGVWNGTDYSSTTALAVLKRDESGNVSPVLVSRTGGASAGGGVFYRVEQLTFDPAGNLVVALDTGVTGTQYEMLSVAPDGTVTERGFCRSENGADALPQGMAADSHGAIYYTRNSDSAVIRVALDGTFTRWTGTPRTGIGVDGTGDGARFSDLRHLCADSAGNIWVADEWSFISFGRGGFAPALRKVTSAGVATSPIGARFFYEESEDAWGTAVDEVGNVYFGSTYAGKWLLDRITPGGSVTNLGGVAICTAVYGGINTTANFAVDSAGNLIVADITHCVLRKTMIDGTWPVFAGAADQIGTTDGTGADARFSFLAAFTTDPRGNYYVLDWSFSTPNWSTAQPDVCVIRRISSTGVVKTLTGNLELNGAAPKGLAVDAEGNFFLAYPQLGTIWRLAVDGTRAQIGGTAGAEGSQDGVGTTARFAAPADLAVDAAGAVYVVDGNGTTIRKGQITALAPAITSQPQDATVPAGQAAQFTVAATGIPAPTFQWRFNGTAIAGATNGTLSLSKVQAANAGSYTVTATNASGSATSAVAALTVAPASSVPGGGTGGGSSGGGAMGADFSAALLLLAAARAAVGKRC